MSVKKLLCGAALASLLSAPAVADVSLTSAQDVTEIASEHDFTEVAAGQSLTLRIETDNFIPDERYRVDVTVTGASKLGAFDPGAVDTVATGEVSDQLLSSKTDGAMTFVITTADAGANSDVGLAANRLLVPIELIPTGCGSTSISIEVTDVTTNLPVENGTATLNAFATDDTTEIDNDAIFICADAFTATINDTNADEAVLTLTSEFTAFGDDPEVLAAKLGEITLSFDNDVQVDQDDGSFSGASISDIDKTTVSLRFEDATGIDTVDVGPVEATQDEDDANLFVAELATTYTGTSDIVVTLDGEESVAQQSVTVVSAVAESALDTVSDKDFTVTGLQGISFEGETFGPFDWVGDATKGTENVFRGTGFDATDVPNAVVTLTNSSEGSAYNGTFDIDLTDKISAGGELVILPADIQAAVEGEFGRADVSFTFFQNGSFDMDRLMSAGGVISAFGDTQNQDDAN